MSAQGQAPAEVQADARDDITLVGLRGFGHHGVYDEERREGQEFVVDVTLTLDTRAAAASDDVADTVHYGEVADDIYAVIVGPPVDLIETLAARIADVVLTRAAVRRVRVCVHKPSAPITVPFTDVTLTIVRDQRAETSA